VIPCGLGIGVVGGMQTSLKTDDGVHARASSAILVGRGDGFMLAVQRMHQVAGGAVDNRDLAGEIYVPLFGKGVDDTVGHRAGVGQGAVGHGVHQPK
jgi:hypothetical protein